MIGLSRRAFAVQVGDSPTAIQRLVSAGKITLAADGSIPMPAGLHEYLAAKSPKKVRPNDGAALAISAAQPSRSEGSPVRAVLELATDIRDAELQQKRWDAALKELKFHRERGLLVPIDEVKADARATCEVIRTTLLGIGPRVALRIEAVCASQAGSVRVATVQGIIDEEVNRALTALNGTRFPSDEHASPLAATTSQPGDA